jgi:murein DD-endopeptidase MepM/ murein hydrolase activator NlpD
MSVNDVTASAAIGRTGQPGTAGDPDRTKVRQLAEQFESMLMAQMLRAMKQAMTPEAEEDHGLGGSMMGDTLTQELALALGRSGSLGLSSFMTTALERLEGAGAEPSPVTVPATAIPAAVSLPAASVAALPVPAAAATPLEARSVPDVTSPYGWRQDPLNGQHRFHAGLDLRAAYGQEVRAATEGTVTFAGEARGYGLVVVVRHESGLETRYAHLSAADVAEGTKVEAGQVIARSGNSGRVTGPHLHFEVRQDGRPVDPGLVAGLMPSVGPAPKAAE